MQSNGRFSLVFKILLPVFITLVIGLAPLPLRFTQELREAHQAQLAGQHTLAAARYRSALQRQPWRVDLCEQVGLEEQAAGRAAESSGCL